MKKLSLSAFALAGLMLAAAPAFADDAPAHHKGHAHHHDHKGKKKCKVKSDKMSEKKGSDDLNSDSLQKAQTPVMPAASKASDMPASMPAMPAAPAKAE